MSRRKKNRGADRKYLPGATWRDVLKGEPVTREDRARRTGVSPMVPHRCRDCATEVKLLKQRLSHKTRRCRACGGVLDPVVDLPAVRADGAA